MEHTNVNRRPNKFFSDKTRVLARPFLPTDPARVARIAHRVLRLSDAETHDILEAIMLSFRKRHRDINTILLSHYKLLLKNLPETDPLRETKSNLPEERKLLLGAYFTSEYSIEAAAFFNPSIVPHPDQTGLAGNATRFIISFRATGEGHVSSIVFRTGIIDEKHHLQFAPVSPYVETPKMIENPSYDKHCFALKLDEIDRLNFVSETILAGLPDNFTLRELNEQILHFDQTYPSNHVHKTVEVIRWLALSNYQLRFREDGDLSECVIFPVSENESKGLEDARFVRFVDMDGMVTYYATYTAYNGISILPQLLATRDFRTFDIATLNGKGIQNKGMALFPRRIGGNYWMISRQDGENMYLMATDNLHFWNDTVLLRQPEEPWELVQLGNCGSPIETEAGWLVLTHGVGPMRQYCIGAMLLDLEEPTRVIGRLKDPVLIPNEEEREGYVPNVVYSCGAMVHGGELILPYAMSDSVSGIATMNMADLLSQLT